MWSPSKFNSWAYLGWWHSSVFIYLFILFFQTGNWQWRGGWRLRRRGTRWVIRVGATWKKQKRSPRHTPRNITTTTTLNLPVLWTLMHNCSPAARHCRNHHIALIAATLTPPPTYGPKKTAYVLCQMAPRDFHGTHLVFVWVLVIVYLFWHITWIMKVLHVFGAPF